jgi:RimJ/RimL family protein N-acetyltransferase
MRMENEHEEAFERRLSGAAVAQLPSGLVPARQVLSGTEVRLEPLNPAEHCQALYEASHGCAEALEIWTYLPFGPWPDVEQFGAWLSQNAASFDYIWYAFRLVATGEIRGMAAFMDMKPTQGVIEIGGIWFAPEMQRTRAATEALFLMLDHAMSDLRYRRMQWRCNALNQKSRNAARRLGFKYEGIFYNHMIFKGLNRDTAWYSILDSDWPAVRDIMAAWLHGNNFDAEGTALSSLTEAMSARAIAPRT